MKHWLRSFDPSVLAMASMRMLSAFIELCAALLMLAFNDVKKRSPSTLDSPSSARL